MIRFFFRSCLFLFLVSCARAAPQQVVPTIADQNEEKEAQRLSFFLEHYDRFFATSFNVSECPGAAVVIVKDSVVVYKRGFGVKQIKTEDSVDVHTVFRIASLSKGVTAMLAGNLADRQELEWQQPIQEVVPTFSLKDKAQASRLTVNHLLSHTAGCYPYTGSKLINSGSSLKTIMANLRYTGVVAKEGTQYAYQNAVFSVLEKVMENTTKQSFDSLLQQRLFVPAGMRSASSTYADIKGNANVALPHRYNHSAKKYYLTNIHKNYYNVAAAGGVNASISDMGEYLKILLGNRPDIISDASRAQMWTPEICTSTTNTMYVNMWDGVTNSYYAKGWRVLEYRGRTIYYHGGNVNQYKGQVMVDPENGLAICVLFNGPNAFNGAVMPTFLSYYDFFKGMQEGL